MLKRSLWIGWGLNEADNIEIQSRKETACLREDEKANITTPLTALSVLRRCFRRTQRGQGLGARKRTPAGSLEES